MSQSKRGSGRVAQLLSALSALAPRQYAKVLESFLELPSGSLPGRLHKYNSRIDHLLRRRWTESDVLWAQGFYRRSVDLRRESLLLLWDSLGLDLDTHWPNGLSPFYSHAIGHFWSAAMFSQAQDAGLIPPGKRYFPAGHVANQEALRALEHLFCVDLRGDSSVGQTLQKVQTPLAWAYFERLEMVKTKLGFLDQYALWEEVQSKRRKHQSPHHKFKLSDSYAEQCVDSLSSIGLDLTKPFVALHLREQPSDPHDHRLASVETYFESIRYLLREGYQVVRVGSPWMRDFPAIDGVLDLVSLKRGDQSSHLWVLNNADFLITTTSGPAFLAAALGTRFLMTNATAIGRNTITGPRGTRYLPKHIINSRNQELSLSAILSSPVGYWEGEKTEATASLRIVPNSPTEILEATLEMISHSSGSSENSEFDLIVDDIRAHEKAVSQGRFSSTFLSDNPRWLE